jgi:uncharacterized protein (DUF427 family)
MDAARPIRTPPAEGQESVWDYPRPPAVVPTDAHVRVVHGGVSIADTHAAIRVLETSQPPAFYIPTADIAMGLLEKTSNRTVCEWKGTASYWSLREPDGAVRENVAWSYETPVEAFASIRGYLAFYAQRVDECWVGDERVVANPGSFYGGWITSAVVGPFKGAPGTGSW